jgi:FkbM family methyltransferase
VYYRRLRPTPTPLGFLLVGEPGLAESRVESGEVPLLRHRLAGVDVMVDVGAHVGLFTCLAAQAEKQVIAIEPQPENLRCLYRSILLNQFRGIEVFPLAVGDEPGVRPLFGGRQGGTLLAQWGGIRSNYANLVPVNTLDNILASRFDGKKLLIKLDVEGE